MQGINAPYLLFSLLAYQISFLFSSTMFNSFLSKSIGPTALLNDRYFMSFSEYIFLTFSCFGLKEYFKAFAMFDDDNSGTISLEEMMMLISKIGGNLTEGEAVGLIR